MSIYRVYKLDSRTRRPNFQLDVYIYIYMLPPPPKKKNNVFRQMSCLYVRVVLDDKADVLKADCS